MAVDTFEVQQSGVDADFALTIYKVSDYADEHAAYDAAVAWARRLVANGADADDVAITEFSDTAPIVTRTAVEWLD